MISKLALERRFQKKDLYFHRNQHLHVHYLGLKTSGVPCLNSGVKRAMVYIMLMFSFNTKINLSFFYLIFKFM